MSYVVTIRRKLSIHDVKLLVDSDPELRVENESDGHLVFVWRPDSEDETWFSYSNGDIDVTSPSDRALEKIQAVSKKLSATVVGEEGENLAGVYPPPVKGVQLWLGWPILVVALLALLFWRW